MPVNKIPFQPVQRSETDLWKAFVDGNKKAFSELYTACYRSLYTYGINLGMEAALVRDAIQELFLKLYDNPKLIRDAASIRPFLFRSIKNYYLNVLKKMERNVGLSLLESDFYNESAIETSFHFNYTIDEKLVAEEEQMELKTKIDRLLELLTPRQREIIYFRFLYEMEYDEISQIMNISEQSARNLLHKAFEKIRKNNPEILPLFLLIQINLL